MDPGFYPTDPPGAEATKGGCHIRLLDNLGPQIFHFCRLPDFFWESFAFKTSLFTKTTVSKYFIFGFTKTTASKYFIFGFTLNSQKVLI